MQPVRMLEPESAPTAPRAARPAAGADEPLSFGARLRAERERRQISIASIADKTKILGALLEGLENDDVSRWPTGFYRRAFFRAYVGAIGLDPEPAVREFAERFPEAEEPAPSLVGVQDGAPITAGGPALRLTLAEGGPFFTGGPVIRAIPTRLRAVTFDAFAVSVIALSLFIAFGAFWAPLGAAVAAYYFASILILGNTPGVCLFAKDAPVRHPKAEGNGAGSV
jgi:transcriptional regulator with XRE-family HTH domain